LIILAVLSIYSYLQSNPSRPPRIALKSAVITLERSACFGGCPVYRLAIYGDGRVFYEGIKFVNATGTRMDQISPDKARALVGEFYKIDYFSLEDKYVEKCGITGCVRVTDLPTITTSITVGGKTKKVIDYYGAPRKLKELEAEIDRAANSERWVKISN